MYVCLHMPRIVVLVCPPKLDFCMEYNSYSPKKLVFSHVFPQKLDFNTHRMQYEWPLRRMLNHVVANRLNTGGKPSTHLSMTPKSSRMGGKQVSFVGGGGHIASHWPFTYIFYVDKY